MSQQTLFQNGSLVLLEIVHSGFSAIYERFTVLKTPSAQEQDTLSFFYVACEVRSTRKALSAKTPKPCRNI